MSKIARWLGAGGLILFVGCSHGPMRGEVAMKVNDREAHIGLGDKEVHPGDRVLLFKNVCNIRSGGKSGFSGCEKVRVGEGQVIQTLNENYSVIQVTPGTPTDEGIIVEKG